MSNASEAVTAILAEFDAAVSPAIQRSIHKDALNLAKHAESLAVDAQGKEHLEFAASILASVHKLQGLLGGCEAARQFVGDALVSSFKLRAAEYVVRRLGVNLDSPQTALPTIAANFIPRGDVLFGKGFRYACERSSPSEFCARIDSCLFDAFFRTMNAPEMTQLLCRLDIVWADALELNCPSIRFDRPTTLAQGDDTCRFLFREVSSRGWNAVSTARRVNQNEKEEM